MAFSKKQNKRKTFTTRTSSLGANFSSFQNLLNKQSKMTLKPPFINICSKRYEAAM